MNTVDQLKLSDPALMEPDLDLIIDEGRRQLDTQRGRLDSLNARASTLLPVGLALALFLLSSAGARDQQDEAIGGLECAALIVGGGAALWGTLIMGAVIAGRSRFQQADATRLSALNPPLKRQLASQYAAMVITGENTVAARVSHLGAGVWWLSVGGILGAASFVL